jgi:hypothetical protein
VSLLFTFTLLIVNRYTREREREKERLCRSLAAYK